jgi:hypothetical protein
VIKEFFTQPARRYRNFQLAFTVLTLNFFIPALVYTFAPLVAHEQFNQLNLLLGGYPYYFPEDQSIFYRVLGSANVFALAFMCAFLQWNLRKHIIVLVPLVFLKMTAATIWLIAYIQRPLLPASLGACVLDAVTSALFVFFAVRAYREIQDVPDEELVPKPKRSILYRLEK